MSIHSPIKYCPGLLYFYLFCLLFNNGKTEQTEVFWIDDHPFKLGLLLTFCHIYHPHFVSRHPRDPSPLTGFGRYVQKGLSGINTVLYTQYSLFILENACEEYREHFNNRDIPGRIRFTCPSVPFSLHLYKRLHRF